MHDINIIGYSGTYNRINDYMKILNYQSNVS